MAKLKTASVGSATGAGVSGGSGLTITVSLSQGRAAILLPEMIMSKELGDD